MSRFPPDCPSGFIGRYFVIEGDTMIIVARRFGTSEEELIAANPHITDPEVIFPFDVLCVPRDTRVMPRVRLSFRGGVRSSG